MREQILNAAIRTASRDGLMGMTLDNVAKEAGLSKGGLIHHFRSKDDLVRSMLEYFGKQAEQMLLHRMESDPVAKLRWARAMLSCIWPQANDPVQPTDDGPLPIETIERFMLTTVAAAVNNPGVFAPLREMGQRMQQRLLDDEHGMDQLLIWLAVDGLLMWQFLGLIQRDDPLFQKIGEALLAKASGATAGSPNDSGGATAGSPSSADVVGAP